MCSSPFSLQILFSHFQLPFKPLLCEALQSRKTSEICKYSQGLSTPIPFLIRVTYIWLLRAMACEVFKISTDEDFTASFCNPSVLGFFLTNKWDSSYCSMYVLSLLLSSLGTGREESNFLLYIPFHQSIHAHYGDPPWTFSLAYPHIWGPPVSLLSSWLFSGSLQ